MKKEFSKKVFELIERNCLEIEESSKNGIISHKLDVDDFTNDLFALCEVVWQSEQLKEKETMSFKDWKKRYKYKKSVVKKMYKQEGVYYSKKQLSQKYTEYLQSL